METHRGQMFALLLAVMALAFACGGGGDDVPDASPDDASPDAYAGVFGLGQVCTSPAQCTTGNTTTCAALSEEATHGFCTLGCGTSSGTDTPPTGGDAICAAEFNGETPAEGTPKCTIFTGSAPNVMWFCAVACGTDGSTDYGGCPGGLTCTANVCQ